MLYAWKLCRLHMGKQINGNEWNILHLNTFCLFFNIFIFIFCFVVCFSFLFLWRKHGWEGAVVIWNGFIWSMIYFGCLLFFIVYFYLPCWQLYTLCWLTEKDSIAVSVFIYWLSLSNPNKNLMMRRAGLTTRIQLCWWI